ncbi:hypothetical protein SHIRM173S_01604 [Streptomyces hirsutus]
MYVPEEQTTETTRSSTGVPFSATAGRTSYTVNEETVTGRAGMSNSSPSRARL